jgi:hypothetical protein
MPIVPEHQRLRPQDHPALGRAVIPWHFFPKLLNHRTSHVSRIRDGNDHFLSTKKGSVRKRTTGANRLVSDVIESKNKVYSPFRFICVVRDQDQMTQDFRFNEYSPSVLVFAESSQFIDSAASRRNEDDPNKRKARGFRGAEVQFIPIVLGHEFQPVMASRQFLYFSKRRA